MGQRTIVHIRNDVGPAGNRKITLFCPYWLVNLTQYVLLFKQDKLSDRMLPAGSLTQNLGDHLASSVQASTVNADNMGDDGGLGSESGKGEVDEENIQGGVEGSRGDSGGLQDEQWSANAGEYRRASGGRSGGTGDLGAGSHRSAGLTWKRGKYHGSFPGSMPLLHGLFRSPRAAQKRSELLKSFVNRASANEPEGSAQASADASRGVPASTTETTAKVSVATQQSKSGADTPSSVNSDTRSHPSQSAAAEAGLGGSGEDAQWERQKHRSGNLDSWRESEGLASFLEQSVGGLLDLPLPEVVALACMFNWADASHR